MTQDVNNTFIVDVRISCNIEDNEADCTWYYNGIAGDNLKCIMSKNYTYIRFRLNDATAARFNLSAVHVTPIGDYTDLQIVPSPTPNELLIANSHTHTGFAVGSVSLTVEPASQAFPGEVAFKAGALTSDPEVVNTGNE